MTELYIDRQPVALPKDFSLECIAENPFLPKTGNTRWNCRSRRPLRRTPKYTAGTTARTTAKPIASNRPAMLVADNDVLLNGTEIIPEITDREVKIQLVSGESELNFLIGGDRKINTPDLGSVDSDIQFTPNGRQTKIRTLTLKSSGYRYILPARIKSSMNT